MKSNALLLPIKVIAVLVAMHCADWHDSPALFLLVYCAVSLLLFAPCRRREARKDLKDFSKILVSAYIVTVLFGASVISLETALISILAAFEWMQSFDGAENFAGKWMVAGALFGVSQYPLDWDYEVRWQDYPFPILTTLEVGHFLGVLLETSRGMLRNLVSST